MSQEPVLDDCGCCEPTAQPTPEEIVNRPGLAAISYRVGTYASFREAMIEAVASKAGLRDWTARGDDDFGVALLDMWSYVGDILTFYQERIANEAFLRTATERASVVRLAALIGYRPAPGLAATAYLAFTLEKGRRALIPVGSRVQSVPGQNEKPQKFETVEEREARAEWNEMAARTKGFVRPGLGSTEIFLRGTGTGLRPGDALLFVGAEREADPRSERWDLRRALTVKTNPQAGHTRVTWDEGLGWVRWPNTVLPSQLNLKVFALRQRASVYGHNAPDWLTLGDAMKVTYLGLTDPRQLTADDKREYPDFQIFAPTSRRQPPDMREPFVSPEDAARAFTAAAQAVAAGAAQEALMAAVQVPTTAATLGKAAVRQTGSAVTDIAQGFGDDLQQIAADAFAPVTNILNSIFSSLGSIGGILGGL